MSESLIESTTTTTNNATNLNESTTTTTDDEEDVLKNFAPYFFTVDVLLVVLNLSGNVLTIIALNMSKKLSALLSNQFIFNLALSDILVGLSIPYHNYFYLGSEFPKIKYLCLLRFAFIFFACSSSIYNLFGIAADRYLAVVYPLHYTRYMTRKVAIAINCFGWSLSFFLASVIIFWNDYDVNNCECQLVKVVPKMYLCLVSVPTFTLIWVTMLVLYAKIWKEAKVHAKRMKNYLGCPYDTVPDDSKSIQVICFILGCFTVCWLPYFTYIAVVTVYGPIYKNLIYEIAFTMAMTNSCMNPFIYAWKNRNFRTAFFNILHCKSPNSYNAKTFITNYEPQKRTVPKINEHSKNNNEHIEMNCNKKRPPNRKDSEENYSVQTTTSVLHF